MKRYCLLFLLAMVCIFSGCLSSGGRRSAEALIEQKPPTLAVLESELPLVAGFNLLEDKRPAQDISYMSSVRENVSAQVLETIKGTEIFSKIDYPALEADALIIRGEIRRFHCESFDTMISYIPFLSVFNLFGLPSTRTLAGVDIYIRVIDAETNKVIFDISEQYVTNTKYNYYNFKEGKANEELSQCFRVVLSRIRQRFIIEKQKIIDALKAKIPVVSLEEKTREETKAIMEEKVKSAEEKVKSAEEKMKEVEKKAEVVEEMAKKVEEKVKAAEERIKSAKEKIGDSPAETEEKKEVVIQ